MKELSGFYDQNAYDFNDKHLMLTEAKVVFLSDMLNFFAKLF